MKDYEIKLSCARGSLTVSPRSACKLIAGGLSGFDSSGFDVSVSPYAALQGGEVTRRRFATRELSITFEIDAVDGEADSIRRGIVSMMDPREDMEMCVTLDGVTRRITVIPYGKADFSRATLYECVLVTLRFISPTVFFTDGAGKRIRFHEVAPLYTFPMNFISGAGTVTGYYRVSDGADITNRGDGECGIVAKIRASGGSVENPGIRLGEKFVRVNSTLSDGDEVEIDTRPKLKRVCINGNRVFTFDRDSEFFSLPQGENRLSITADSGGEFIDAEILFHEVYFGA